MAATHDTGSGRPPAPFGTDVLILDGCWDFFVGDGDLAGMADHEPAAITVPGLWEAQGFLELDRVADAPRRAGDPPILVASSRQIASELGWAPEKPELTTMIADAWAWMRASALESAEWPS